MEQTIYGKYTHFMIPEVSDCKETTLHKNIKTLLERNNNYVLHR